MVSESSSQPLHPVDGLTRFPGRLVRFFAQRKSQQENACQTQSSKRTLEPHEQVLALLAHAQLRPTPPAYKLAWEYHFGTCLQLRQAIDGILERDGRLSQHSVKELNEKYLQHWDDDEIASLVASGKQALRDGFRVISQNRGDNHEYGKALTQKVEEIDGARGRGTQPFHALIDLTQAMVEKSLKAEKQLRRAENHLAEMREKLADATRKAETDQLTGLPNRWAFDEYLKMSVLKAKASLEPLTIAFIDIDNFKSINDNHGHATGDRVLRKVAIFLDRTTDENCYIARHGGEEFVMLLHGRTVQESYDIVDSVRSDLAEKNMKNRETGEPIGLVSFSAGIAMLDGCGDANSMLARADTALYEAKQNGRNQIVVHNIT